MQVNKNWLKPVTPLMVGKSSYNKTGLTFNFFISPDDIVSAAEAMYAKAYHIEDIDVLDVEEGFLVTYHYTHFTEPGRIAHRVLISREDPQLPTISKIYQGADWHERECHDFHGVIFSGHPNLIALLLDPETPSGVLLKDDKNRKPLRDLVDPGEVVFKDGGFTVFDNKKPEETDADPV